MDPKFLELIQQALDSGATLVALALVLKAVMPVVHWAFGLGLAAILSRFGMHLLFATNRLSQISEELYRVYTGRMRIPGLWTYAELKTISRAVEEYASLKERE